MGVDANGVLLYGYIETQKSKVDWSDMADVEGDDYEEWDQKLEKFHISTGYVAERRYIAAEYISASHRYWETIKPEKLTAIPEWDERLKGYAKEVGIDLRDEKPQWHLIAYFD